MIEYKVMKKIDMSGRAISKRLRQTDQLRRLSLSLMKAKREHDLRQAEIVSKEVEGRNPEIKNR